MSSKDYKDSEDYKKRIEVYASKIVAKQLIEEAFLEYDSARSQSVNA